MRQQSNPPPTQFALDLRREAKELPIALESTAVLQALADLLLGALGEQIEERTSAVHGEGGADDSEDHT